VDVGAVCPVVPAAQRARKLINVLQMVAAGFLGIADRDLPVSIDISGLSRGCSAHETSTAANREIRAARVSFPINAGNRRLFRSRNHWLQNLLRLFSFGLLYSWKSAV
jgi:hypothetical protein